MNNKLKIILKSFFSISLIVLILSRVQWNTISKLFLNINVHYLILSFMCLALYYLMISYRQYLILNALDVQISFKKSVIINHIAVFFSNILPSRFGADVIKVLYIKDKSGSFLKPSLGILCDRFTGILSFIILNIMAIMGGFHLIAPWIILTTLMIDILLIAVMAMLYFHPEKSQRFFLGALKKFLINTQTNKVDISHSIRALKKKPFYLFYAITLSFVLNLLLIILNYVYSLAINLDIPIYYFFIYIPLTITITILPISINGLGVREFLIIVMFKAAGLNINEAFSLSLINRFALMTYSLIGSFFYVTTKKTDHETPIKT